MASTTGYRLIGKNRLIPRISCTGRHRVWQKTDLDNPFENGSLSVAYTDFTAIECVIQPITGKALRDQNEKLLDEGGNEYDSYTVYTTTRLLRAREGTNDLADQLLLPDSRGEDTWFTTIKCDPHPSSGVQRYKVYLIAIPEGTEGGI